MESSSLVHIVEFHQKIHPGFSAQDAYKLIFQRHMGTEHLIPDLDSPRKFLQDELDKVVPDSNALLVEPLWEDFRVSRINLAPFKAKEINFEMLLAAFLESSEPLDGVVRAFLDEWMDFIWLVKNGLLNLNLDDVEKVNRIALENDYPAMHHSDHYVKLNNPAYRIAKLDPLLENIPELECEIKEFKFENIKK
jgi:hypothetical protein